MRAKGMTEAQLQSMTIDLAARIGWMSYHTHDSRRSQPGFPDLVLVHPRQRRVLWRELKSEIGRLRSEQATWVEALRLVGQDVGVWRPSDWTSGRIERELRGK